MSFYTALTGLNSSQADISASSNNIANVGTTGFKKAELNLVIFSQHRHYKMHHLQLAQVQSLKVLNNSSRKVTLQHL